LKAVPFDDVRISGALDRDVTADGIVLRRLPAWTRPQIPDVNFALMVSMAAGVRLELVTDATAIELDVMLTLLELDEQPVRPAAFDLVVDGERAASAESTEGTCILYDPFTGKVAFRAGAPTTIRFADLPANGPAHVELWLPHNCVVELRELRVSRVAHVAHPPASGRRRWAHYGSSISHCFEARRPTETWPGIASRLAGVELHNLAFAGQCMLDPLVARTLRDLHADLISVKAGINVVKATPCASAPSVPPCTGSSTPCATGIPRPRSRW
jgi:hypothetical protein